MTPLVCMAPDGSLEVWGHAYDNYSRVESEHCLTDYWMDEDGYITHDIWDGPEFWGREILGDL